MKFSLGILLALCLAGLQFVAVTVVVSSSYVSSQRVLLEHARNLLSDVGINTIEHAKGFLNPARGAAELAARLAENRIVASENRQLLEQLLFQQLRIAPQFAGVYYGDEDGSFVYVMRSKGPGPFRTKIVSFDEGVRKTELIWRDTDFQLVEQRLDPTDTYDPTVRPWYMDARAALGSIWTDPYIFFSSQSPGITIASPVIADDGDLRGVIGVDIEIAEISEFLSHLSIGESGVALILNQNGDVIAHPNQELITAANGDGTLRFVHISEIDDSVARDAFGALADAGPIAISRETYEKFDHDEAAYVSTVMPRISNELPWTIAVYAPENDFIGEIKANRAENVWIAAAVALATALIGLFLANFIHKPVRAFAVRAALISQGEIDPSEEAPKTYRELDLANETLMREISQRKQSEQEYGQTFDLSSRGMVQIAPDTGRFTRVNAKFAEITGYSEEELLTKTAAELSHPDEALLLPRSIGGESDDQAYTGEQRCVRKDGEIVWVNVNAILIRDDEDNPVHTVATIDDITSSKLAEAQIQTLNRDLSHIARGEVLGQMAAGLAHELNQPLTAIAQNADTALLTARELKEADPELVQTLSDIEQQAHRAGDIIRALRNFARKGDEEPTTFDIVKLLRQTLHLVRPEANESGVRIFVESAVLPNVSGIRVQVAQVIVNLLRNAIEAIADTSDNDRQVLVKAHVVDTHIEVAIEDTGPGVSPSFDVFSQFETTKREGMGLGLSICRSIIETGDGKLWHDESYTDGARFCFTVPIAPT